MSRRPLVARPARLVAGAFALATALGTVLLALPVSARRDDVTLLDALFTATSAVCVTGLTVVDTGTTWSGFGLVVIVVLAQLGGLGIMTLATIVALIIGRRLGMRTRTMAQAEAGAIPPGQLRRVLVGVAVSALVVEGLVALVLAGRFWLAYERTLLGALGDGVFYAVMAFNNAGFGLRPDNLTAFVTDWWVNVPIMVAVVIGGLGFPVLVELVRRRRGGPWRLSLHARLTLTATAVLLVVGALAVLAFEWGNPGTLGPLAVPDKLLAGSFASVSARTAGFNTVDIGAMRETTWLLTDLLMFVGSGSASTGGGIKVTTLAVLVLVSVTELRGERDVTWGGRTLPAVVVRQALAVTLIALAVVGGVTTFLLARNPGLPLDTVLFESLSAFGTVGLSTGITPGLDSPSQLALAAMMFFGRVGPVTLGAAFVLRTRDRLYRHPEERPLSDDRRGLAARLSRALGAGRPDVSDVLVVGLGRFGSSLALALTDLGHAVLAVDEDPELVQRFAGVLTQTVVADATDVDALRQLGAGEFRHAVVAIGTGIEASVLAVTALADAGLQDIWAKAISEPHARILARVGAHHVVQPERDMGRRTAHLITGRMLEYLPLDDGFSLVETRAATSLVGRSLAQSELRRRFDVTVVCIKPEGGRFTYATADTVVGEGDILVLAGTTAALDAYTRDLT